MVVCVVRSHGKRAIRSFILSLFLVTSTVSSTNAAGAFQHAVRSSSRWSSAAGGTLLSGTKPTWRNGDFRIPCASNAKKNENGVFPRSTQPAADGRCFDPLLVLLKAHVVPPTSSSSSGTNRSSRSISKNSNGSKLTSSSTSSTSSDLRLMDARSLERKLVHLSRAGRIDEALDLYSSLWDTTTTTTRNPNLSPIKHIQPTTRLMNVMIDICARARPTPRIDAANRIFVDGINGGKLKPNVFTFGALMKVHAKAGDADGAVRLLRSTQKEYGIRPNAVVYSTAISACERSIPPKADLALQLLGEATRDPTVQMSVVGYNAAISALARAGEWETAVRLLDEMECGGGVGGCSPLEMIRNDGNENSAAAANVGIGEQNERESKDISGRNANTDTTPPLLHPDVVPPPPDEVTYGTVMAACERSEQWVEVLRFAQAMQRHVPTIDMDGMAITSALHACQRLGLADEALSYLNMMKKLSKTGTTVPEEEENGMDNRNKNQRRQPLQGPDAVAYRLAISACARSPGGNRWEDGVRLLGEMKKVTGTAPDVVAYTAAIAGCAQAGEWIRAFQLLDTMRKEGVQPNVVTYSVVIDACATASANAARQREETGNGSIAPDADDAVKTPMKKAMQLLNALKNDKTVVDPNIVTYNAAIRACAEGLDLKGAFDLLDDLRSRGLKPTLVTYGSLMTACERVGDVEGASKVFRLMKEENSDEADDETMIPNEIIYGAAISCCRKAGQAERAFLLLKKMVKDGLFPNTATFNTVLMAQCERNSIKGLESAILVYKLMKSRYAPHETQKPNRQTYNIIIRAFAANKRPREAEWFIRRMQADGIVPDVDLFTATVSAYERCGQPLKAIRLMESMNRDGYDFYEVKVLNEAFKKAIRLVNAVGSGLTGETSDSEVDDIEINGMDDVEGEDEEIFQNDR